MPYNPLYVAGLDEGETVTIAELDAIDAGFAACSYTFYQASQNLDDVNVFTAEALNINLGIQFGAYATVGTTIGTVAAGDHTHPMLPPPNNLTELTDVSAARSNLGLGDSAVLNVGTTSGTVAASDHVHAAAGLYWDNTGYTGDVPTPDIFTALQNFEISMFSGDIVAKVEEMLLTTYPATIASGYDIPANTQNMVLTTYPATIGIEFDIPANTQNFTLTTYPADISQATNVEANTQEFTLTTYPAKVSQGTNVQASTQNFTLTTYPASIT